MERARASVMLRNIGVTFLTRLAVMAIGVVSSVLAARLLGPAGRGEYAAAAAVAGFAVSFGNLGLHNANTFLVAGHRDRLGALFGNTLAVGLVWGGALGVMVLVGARWLWVAAFNISELAVWAALLVPGMLTYNLLQNLVMGVERFDVFNRAEIVNASGNLIVTLLAVLLGVLTPAFVLASSFTMWLVSGAFLLVFLSGAAPARLSVQLLRQALAFGWRPYALSLASFSISRMDLLVVNNRLGTSAAGEYSVALTLASLFATMPAIVGQVLFPRLGGLESREAKWRMMLRMASLTAVVLTLTALAVGFMAEPLVRLLFGAPFVPAVSPLRLLLCGAVLMGVHVVVVQYLNSLGCPRSVVLLWAVAAVLNWRLNVLGVGMLGVNGAALASIATYAFTLSGILMLAWRHRPSASALPST